MTIQQKVVAFLKALGKEKVMHTFQVSRQVASVWMNAGNVPISKLDRVLEEMEKFNSEQENQQRAEEAKSRDEAAISVPPAPAGDLDQPRKGPAEPEESLFTPVAVPMPVSKDAIEAEFQEVRSRLERLEKFAMRMTDPDLVTTSSFTRPEHNQNKPNSIMEPTFKPVDTTPMTEAEHEKAMGEVGEKIPGSSDWLTPYKSPPYQKK